jgi:hypothetical protein
MPPPGAQWHWADIRRVHARLAFVAPFFARGFESGVFAAAIRPIFLACTHRFR